MYLPQDALEDCNVTIRPLRRSGDRPVYPSRPDTSVLQDNISSIIQQSCVGRGPDATPSQTQGGASRKAAQKPRELQTAGTKSIFYS